MKPIVQAWLLLALVFALLLTGCTTKPPPIPDFLSMPDGSRYMPLPGEHYGPGGPWTNGRFGP